MCIVHLVVAGSLWHGCQEPFQVLVRVRGQIKQTGLLIGCGKNGRFCGIFKGNYAARKVYYAANYAIFLKLIYRNMFF